MRTVIISLGGSLIVPSEVDVAFLRNFKKLLSNRPCRFAVICGGGKICRDYQSFAKDISGISTHDLDWIGIASTRLNAELLRTVFGEVAYNKVIVNPNEKVRTGKKIIIGAGYLPGCSTDKDAILSAKNLKAKVVINMSNVKYVYDKDPKKHRNAKPIKRLTWRQYLQIVGKKWVPGLNTPFDPIAAQEAEKHSIRVIIMGSDLRNLKDYLDGKQFKGTVIE